MGRSTRADRDRLGCGWATELAHAASDATVGKHDRRTGVVKPKRRAAHRTSIDANGALFIPASHAHGLVHFGQSHADEPGVGKWRQRSARTDMRAFQSIADDTGRLIGIDDRRPRRRHVRRVQRDNTLGGADVDAVAAAQAGFVESGFFDGARRAKVIRWSGYRKTFREIIGDRPDHASNGIDEKISAWNVGHTKRILHERVWRALTQ